MDIDEITRQNPYLNSITTELKLDRLTGGGPFGGIGGGGFLNKFKLQVNSSDPTQGVSGHAGVFAAPFFRGPDAVSNVVKALNGIKDSVNSLASTFRTLGDLDSFVRRREYSETIKSTAVSVTSEGTAGTTGSAATAATALFGSVQLGGPQAATYTTYTGGSAVTLDTSTSDTYAAQQFSTDSPLSSGGPNADPTDYGSAVINGYNVDFGIYSPNGDQSKTTNAAINFLADKINNTAGLKDEVTAYRQGNKLVIESKFAGSSGTVNISSVTADSDSNGANDRASGLTVTSYTGTDATTNFGSVTVNGVTTNVGSIINRDYTQAQAAQFIADAINNDSNQTVTASVNGSNKLVFTQKTAGSGANITVSGTGTAFTGLAAGSTVQGQDGGTDFGDVTINGVTTSIGFYNNATYTAADAAQFIADKINADAAQTVSATVEGDRVRLTQKTEGASNTIDVSGVGDTAQGQSTGLVLGNTANGTDAVAATPGSETVTETTATTSATVTRVEESLAPGVRERFDQLARALTDSLDRLRQERGIEGVTAFVKDVEHALRSLDPSGQTHGLDDLGIRINIDHNQVTIDVDDQKLIAAFNQNPGGVKAAFNAEADKLDQLAGGIGFEAQRLDEISKIVPDLAGLTADLLALQGEGELLDSQLRVTDKIAREAAREKPKTEELDQEKTKDEVKAGDDVDEKKKIEAKEAPKADKPAPDFRVQQIQAIAQSVQPSATPKPAT